jgi:hypothetical protein
VKLPNPRPFLALCFLVSVSVRPGIYQPIYAAGCCNIKRLSPLHTVYCVVPCQSLQVNPSHLWVCLFRYAFILSRRHRQITCSAILPVSLSLFPTFQASTSVIPFQFPLSSAVPTHLLPCPRRPDPASRSSGHGARLRTRTNQPAPTERASRSTSRATPRPPLLAAETTAPGHGLPCLNRICCPSSRVSSSYATPRWKQQTPLPRVPTPCP